MKRLSLSLIFCLFLLVLLLSGGALDAQASPAGGEVTAATPKFMTLPFTDASVKIQQGWLCHWSGCASTYPPNGVHGGIDYIRLSGSAWVGFDVAAAADGLAYCSYTAAYGNYVIIEHSGAGAGYYSYYAHLKNCDAALPAGTPVQVVRGQRLGLAGESGSAQGTGIHLHFAVCTGSRTQCAFPPPGWTPYPYQMIDPYEIYSTYSAYPPGGALGDGHLFTTNPPQVPGAQPPSGEVVIVEEPTLTPAYSGDMCGTAWHRFANERGHNAYLTLNTNQAAQSTNSATWTPTLPCAGDYQVAAYIPNHAPLNWQCPSLLISWDSADAHYTIRHAGGSSPVARDQSPLANQWLALGTYTFNAGSAGSVRLSDLNDETALSRTVSFSALKFTRTQACPVTPPVRYKRYLPAVTR